MNILVNNKRAVFVKQIGKKYYFTLPNVAEVSTVEISRVLTHAHSFWIKGVGRDFHC